MEDPAPSDPRRLPVFAGLAALAFVQARISLSDVQRYGDDGAPWIEHTERLAVLEALQGGPRAGFFADLDGAFPPGMHLVSAALNPLGAGLSDLAVTRTSILWLFLLALAVAAVAHRWKPGAGPWAFALTCFLPAAQACATRYYYDLPMTAALWAALAAGVAGLRPGRAGWHAGAAFGALWFAACLVKWTALPFGAVMLLALFLDPRRVGPVARLQAVVAAVAVAAAGVLLWRVAAGDGSIATMAGATYGGDREALDLKARLDGLLHHTRLHGTFGPDRTTYYPAALATHVLAPLGVAALALPLAAWLLVGKGRAALVALVVGQFAFLVAFVGVTDQRFALTAGPAPLLAAALGIAALHGRRGRALLGGVTLGGLVVVCAEHHFGVPPLPRDEIEIESLNDLVHTRSYATGAALADSFEGRGWRARSTEPPSHREARDAVVRLLDACAPAHVAVADLGPNSPPAEDWLWHEYLVARARLRGHPFEYSRGCDEAEGADLILSANLEERPRCVPGDWVDAAVLPLPDTFDYDGHVWLPPDADCAR